MGGIYPTFYQDIIIIYNNLISETFTSRTQVEEAVKKIEQNVNCTLVKTSLRNSNNI